MQALLLPAGVPGRAGHCSSASVDVWMSKHPSIQPFRHCPRRASAAEARGRPRDSPSRTARGMPACSEWRCHSVTPGSPSAAKSVQARCGSPRPRRPPVLWLQRPSALRAPDGRTPGPRGWSRSRAGIPCRGSTVQLLLARSPREETPGQAEIAVLTCRYGEPKDGSFPAMRLGVFPATYAKAG